MKTAVTGFKLLGLSLFCLVLAGCLSTTSTKTVQKVYPEKMTFNKVVASGPMQIQLVRAPAGTPITVTGWPESVARTSVWLTSDTVHLTNSWLGLVLVPGTTVVTIPVGDTQTFTADLSDQAIMQVQNVKFANMNLKTSDVAHAQVYVLDNLNIVAKDNSSVFYYGNPKSVHIVRPKCTAEIQHFKTLKG